MPSPTPEPWWRSATIYQIYPRSFLDSDGDGVGDLEGARRQLVHLSWLGVDAVWLSPFYRSPMRDFGYDVSDYCDVDPLFGTLDDFDILSRISRRDVKVRHGQAEVIGTWRQPIEEVEAVGVRDRARDRGARRVVERDSDAADSVLAQPLR